MANLFIAFYSAKNMFLTQFYLQSNYADLHVFSAAQMFNPNLLTYALRQATAETTTATTATADGSNRRQQYERTCWK